MLSLNKVMLTGRLTRDPETKYLSSGTAVTNLGIAVNRRFLDKNNEWRDETTFLDVETWGKLAERCAETLKKGRPVYVEGRLKSDSWEKDGQKQTKIRISADRVSPFDVPSRGDGGADMSADEGEAEAPRQSQNPRPGSRGAAPTSAPSNGLDFPNANVEDDIPF
jgi:single-strand DNA-binding protein